MYLRLRYYTRRLVPRRERDSKPEGMRRTREYPGFGWAATEQNQSIVICRKDSWKLRNIDSSRRSSGEVHSANIWRAFATSLFKFPLHLSLLQLSVSAILELSSGSDHSYRMRAEFVLHVHQLFHYLSQDRKLRAAFEKVRYKCFSLRF